MDLLLVGMLGVLIVMMTLNSRKRKRTAEELKANLIEGAEVMLTSGITGKVISLEDEHVVIESTPKTRLRVVKGAVVKVEQPVTVDADSSEEK